MSCNICGDCWSLQKTGWAWPSQPTKLLQNVTSLQVSCDLSTSLQGRNCGAHHGQNFSATLTTHISTISFTKAPTWPLTVPYPPLRTFDCAISSGYYPPIAANASSYIAQSSSPEDVGFTQLLQLWSMQFCTWQKRQTDESHRAKKLRKENESFASENLSITCIASSATRHFSGLINRSIISEPLWSRQALQD